MPDPRTLDELSVGLGRLRSAAGAPSYAEIARRIGAVRGSEPAKVTVYDCFRPGRRRVDEALVGDIVQALGADHAEADRWRSLARTLNGDRSGVHVEVVVAPRETAGAEIGRERLLTELPRADITLVTGLPGVGKSTFASALAGAAPALTVQLRESEPDRPIADPVDVLRRMLAALGSRSLPYELTRLRAQLQAAAGSTTLILEDAVDPRRLGALLVPGVRFIVTSRVDQVDLEQRLRARSIAVSRIRLEPLADDDARRLLVALLTRRGRQFPAEGMDAAALDRIVAVAGGLPLDLAMLAGIVREHEGWSFADLASRFEHEPRDVRMRPVLEAATRSLPAHEADLLADLALLDREVDETVLLTAAGAGAAARLERLRARHLVERHDGRVRLHDTVFAFAADRSRALRPTSVRRRFVGAAASTVLARAAADRDYPAREVATVLAVAAAAHEHGLDAEVERLALASHPALSRWSLWAESLELHDLASRGSGLELVPEVALGVAHCAEKLGRLDEALVTLHRVRRIASGAASARTWNQIGNVQRWMSHLDEALVSYARAVERARAVGDRVVEGRALGNRADTLRILARYPEAERGYAVALELATAAGDDLNIAVVRGNRPLLYLAVGRLDEATAELEALLSDAGGEALPFVHRTLALVAEAQGDDALAVVRCDDARRALQVAGEFGTSADLDLLAARIDGRAGRTERARREAERVLREAERAGSPLIATEASNSLAEILARPGAPLADVERAEQHAAEARSIAEATGDRAEVARSDAILAATARARGDEAVASARQAASRELSAELGHRLVQV